MASHLNNQIPWHPMAARYTTLQCVGPRQRHGTSEGMVTIVMVKLRESNTCSDSSILTSSNELSVIIETASTVMVHCYQL